jgi:hypothetical protein
VIRCSGRGVSPLGLPIRGGHAGDGGHEVAGPLPALELADQRLRVGQHGLQLAVERAGLVPHHLQLEGRVEADVPQRLQVADVHLVDLGPLAGVLEPVVGEVVVPEEDPHSLKGLWVVLPQLGADLVHVGGHAVPPRVRRPGLL